MIMSNIEKKQILQRKKEVEAFEDEQVRRFAEEQARRDRVIRE